MPNRLFDSDLRQQLEHERALRAEAERQSRLKDDFIATLGHELRTPLNAIVGWSALLSRDEANPVSVREGLDIIARNASAQSKLIEDLLDMSRVVAGRIRLEIQRVDLTAVVIAAVAAVRHAADAKRIVISQSVDPFAVPVDGDPARLQQVVWNLLSNAIKFTPAGGRVGVELERVDRHMELSVTDSGIGIRADLLPHVFERFRQEEGSPTRRQSGLGLGLSIVKHLVDLHHGECRAESPGLGHGSVFVVSLPAGQAPAAAMAGDRFPRAVDSLWQLKGVRVLVVDDEPDARHLLRCLLAEYRCEVRTSASAADALTDLALFRPQLLISDIGMAGADGYELIRTVREKPATAGGRVPAVALTAFARADDRRRALAAGFDAHLTKPVDADELVATLTRLVPSPGMAGRGLG